MKDPSAAYSVGDVVEGRFSAEPLRKVRAIVGGRVPDAGQGRAGFHGDVLDYVTGKGYGTWGYDDEIVSVRPATDDDHAAAADVRARVSADTDRMLGRA